MFINGQHVPVWKSPGVTIHSAPSLWAWVGGHKDQHWTCSDRMNKKNVRTSSYLEAPMLPTIMTAPMMPMRLYLGTVLDSCLRITMCKSSWEQRQNKEVCQWVRGWKEEAGNMLDVKRKLSFECTPGCETPAAVAQRQVCPGGGRVCGSAGVWGCPCSPRFPV